MMQNAPPCDMSVESPEAPRIAGTTVSATCACAFSERPRAALKGGGDPRIERSHASDGAEPERRTSP